MPIHLAVVAQRCERRVTGGGGAGELCRPEGGPVLADAGDAGGTELGARGTAAWAPVEDPDCVPERLADPAADSGERVLVKRRGRRGSGRHRQRGEAPASRSRPEAAAEPGRSGPGVSSPALHRAEPAAS